MRSPSLLWRDYFNNTLTLTGKPYTYMVQSQTIEPPTLSAVLNRHKVIFLMNLGVLRGTSAKLYVDQ